MGKTKSKIGECEGQALPAGVRLEEFTVECVIGSGGFGITYLARDERLKRAVVIKENLPAQFAFRDSRTLHVRSRKAAESDAEDFEWSLRNFEREAVTLASLEHPNIVRVLRSFEAYGTAYFVMPYLEGESLEGIIKRRFAAGETFGEEEVEGWLKAMLSALDYLHSREIFHRDIKPGNVLVTRDGRPVLIDFGSARQQVGERSMTVVESIGYTAFEQLQSRGEVGPWSDLYSLGATIHKALTGKTPARSTDRITEDQHEPLAGRESLKGKFSPRLLESVDRAMAPGTKQRLRSAREWLEFLEGGKERVDRAGGKGGSKAEGGRGFGRLGRVKGARGATAFAASAAALALALGFGGFLKDWFVPPMVELLVTTDPPGAEIEVEGVAGGAAPFRAELPRGRYEVVASFHGWPEQRRSVEAVVGAPVELSFAFEAVRVRVESDPPGAKVSDRQTGELVGTAPFELHETVEQLQPGPVNWEFTLEGHAPYGYSGSLAEGANPLVRAALAPLPSSLAVTSDPAGAEVLINGDAVGETPLNAGLGAGEHEVVVRFRGWPEQRRAVEVGPGQSRQEGFVFLPVQVGVDSRPRRATVKERETGRLLGTTPLRLGAAEGIEPGPFAWEFTLEGHASHSYSGVLVGGGNQDVVVEFSPLPSGLEITSDPPGAGIEVNGRPGGAAPVVEDLAPGSYRVTATHPGWPSQTQTVEVKPGVSGQVHFEFQPVSVSLSSEPPGARVRDSRGRDLGSTPLELGEGLVPGAASWSFEMEGYRAVEAQAVLLPGENDPLRISLERDLPVRVTELREATRLNPYVNSLGLEFVPVPSHRGVWMARSETRVQDFRAYAEAAGYRQAGGVQIPELRSHSDGGREMEMVIDRNASWRNPGFEQTDEHPVVGVNWIEAKEFCEWLSGEEPGLRYRLPRSAEWSAAAGGGRYPWGDEWPPPEAAGHYNYSALRRATTGGARGRTAQEAGPPLRYTVPVRRHRPNGAGFFDLGGNVWEWCEDEHPEHPGWRILRGGSYTNRIDRYFDSDYLMRGRMGPLEGGTLQVAMRTADWGFRLVVELGEDLLAAP